MSSYVLSQANRFYAAVEATYGQAVAVSAGNRLVARHLTARQIMRPSARKDKTGSRTFSGTMVNQRATAYELKSFLTSQLASGFPVCGPLFQAALGGVGQGAGTITVASMSGATTISTATPHGLSIGAAVTYEGEIRFVAAVPDQSTLQLNAPLSNLIPANGALGIAVAYRPGTALPSVTLYDYWDPAGAVDRIITGAAVDTMEISVAGDVHEFIFSGQAADVIDSASFVAGTGGLGAFPTEPASGGFDYSTVSGQLGQVWLGSNAAQFFTLLEAQVVLQNNVAVRAGEFGSVQPLAMTPGARQISVEFTLLAQTDVQTEALYAAARQGTPIGAMLQLGQQTGQTMGIYLPNVLPSVPVFDDEGPRLAWQFTNNLASGANNDELYLGFA